MTQEALDLLPYEFARANRVLRDNGELLLGQDAPDWAIAEVSRISSGDLKVSNIADEDFDALLSKLYSGTQNSSEAVMANIQDLVGRGKDMNEIIKGIYQNRFVNVLGLPGIGKTTISRYIGLYLEERNRFKDGIIYISLRNSRSANMLITAFSSDPE